MRILGATIHLWSWSRRLTAALFLMLLVLGTYSGAPWLSGSLSATTMVDVVPLVDPLAAVETLLASRSITADALIGATILLIAALILGPVFCAWFCPLGLLLDLNHALQRAISRRFSRRLPTPLAGPLPVSMRYAILGAVVGFALVARTPLFQIISPINIMVRGILFDAGKGFYLVAAICILEHLWPRFWCRILCPLGALYSLVGQFALLRIWIDLDQTTNNPCRLCSRRCPMGINVTDDYVVKRKRSVNHPSCTRCGDCADRCPQDVLSLGFHMQ
jgi:ferredoxin-type protein NapH